VTQLPPGSDSDIMASDVAKDPSLALDLRSGWPAELHVLMTQYPRETWMEHRNLGGMARFWLQRHDMFRELGGVINSCMNEYREGQLNGAAFPQKLVRPLQFFLGELNTHHQVEDYHYFPKFRIGDARLEKGFDALDVDHHLIHESIEKTVAVANAMLQGFGAAIQNAALKDANGQPVVSIGDQLRGAIDDYARESDLLVTRAIAHLRDEEDLIVPLILDRSEEALGVAE